MIPPYTISPLTAVQLGTIQSLISVAENSTTEWWKQYGYCENINDGRGYTIGIVGFCTGTGDFLWLVEHLPKTHSLRHFIPALKKLNGTSKTDGLSVMVQWIKTYGNTNLEFQKAQWDTIHHFYLSMVQDLIAKYSLKNAVTVGQLYDIAINAGDFNCIKDIQFKTEEQWLVDINNAWLDWITKKDHSLDSGQPDRALMWKSLQSNPSLTCPINVTCYNDKYTL